jgi:hypothetical protein
MDKLWADLNTILSLLLPLKSMKFLDQVSSSQVLKKDIAAQNY